jgi:RNA polymerase sigma-70 factor (ECF subfamily)
MESTLVVSILNWTRWNSLVLRKPQESSEDLLVQQAIRLDREAFAALYDCYVDRVYRHVYYHVSNHADAEDITQEVFVRAWGAIVKYKTTGAPFVAWLFAIAHNLITDHYRAKKNPIPLDDVIDRGEALNQTEETSPEAMTEADFDRGCVRHAILRLKGDKQKVILMRFIDGFSHEEIAKALNKTEGAIRVIQFRALCDLRRMLRQGE